ncbi:electron transfer flavoprotein beta subunit [Candidatus Hakubella thermalkaliphila]|uniref:Electron transfer flavoprotein small subunit n=1 Tax=Candidatus Hakubella thermalkaliphila TaxID=2754717 RepID=A0A6V8PHF9_9ACTN|nr:electron transfer flavoprotein beta subunit [Candidatus Hakubella thermalkaliphila]
MHSVVCIKQVPDTTDVKIDRKTNTLIREGVPSIVNPFDIHAIEEALRLKDRFGGRITVISMGPPQARESLKKAISYGVDEAILISDRAFAGADTLATSYVLAQTIRAIGDKEPVDLVLCGKQAIDGDTAQVGPGIATRLGISQLTYVAKIRSIDLEKKEIVVERQLEGGREALRAELPALLTVVKELNTSRYQSLPSMIRAARYDPPVWDKDSFDRDPSLLGLKGSPTKVSKVYVPPPREKGGIIAGDPEDPEKTVAELVDKLLECKIIG